MHGPGETSILQHFASGITLIIRIFSLAKYLRAFERLKHLSVRLSQYFGSTRVVSFKSPTLENITGLKTVACKLVQSLLEVIRAIQVLDELQRSTPNKLISALQTMVAEVSSSRDGLTRLRSAIESHSSYTLLEGVSYYHP